MGNRNGRKISIKKEPFVTKNVSALFVKIFVMLALVLSPIQFLSPSNKSVSAAFSPDKLISYVDAKAEASPGESLTVTAYLFNKTLPDLINPKVSFYVKKQGQSDVISTADVTIPLIKKGKRTTASMNWTLPNEIGASYTIEAFIRDSNNNILENMTTTTVKTVKTVIQEVYTDLPRYLPGQKVKITAKLKNMTNAAISNGTVTFYFKHLEREIRDPHQVQIDTLDINQEKEIPFEWEPPTADFKGYMIEAWVRDAAGNDINQKNTAVDVSSTWTKFPRYGYLTSYKENEPTEQIIKNLAQYHINALQFYDWHWQHHRPITQDTALFWNEISGKAVYKQTVKDYINTAKAHNMSSMAYNLLYGAFNNYQYNDNGSGASEVSRNWGIFKKLEFVNPSFEDNLHGWSEWHPDDQAANYGVDSIDAKAGSKKLYFYSASKYQQKVTQRVYVENGAYKVIAWVKMTGPTPTTARMQVNHAIKNIDPAGGASYLPYLQDINVTDGKIDLEFYIDSPGGTSMQIDDITLERNQLTNNAGFELGDTTGWTEWHPEGQTVSAQTYGVNDTDAFEGIKKLYFWNENATSYHQSVHQTKTGLEPGQYTASVWVKTTGNFPHAARLEANGELAEVVAVNGGKWHKLSKDFEVTASGTASIGFYVNLPVQGGVQIDHFVLNKFADMQWGYGDFPSNWMTPTLWLMNPGNAGWQNYLTNEFKNKVFAEYNFDGWHMDQIGDWPGILKYDDKGAPIVQKNGFASFIEAAKLKIPDKTFIFNTVNSFGYKEVAASAKLNKGVDVMYSELWKQRNEDDGADLQAERDFSNIKTLLDDQTLRSGGKATVFPMYMNYDFSQDIEKQRDSSSMQGLFNEPGILLADAGFFAMGADHLELGDDVHMLSHEYFLNKNLKMSDDLKKKLLVYYSFRVAYENLLRDGLDNTTNKVSLKDPQDQQNPNAELSSSTSDPQKVWTFTKAGKGYEVIHLINQLGLTDNIVNDKHGMKPAPTSKENLKLKYYYTGPVNQVNFASPDYMNGTTIQLPFTRGVDGDGAFIEFIVPTLQYWDMIYINKGKAGNRLANGDFEAGDLSGWTEWHPAGQQVSFGVDGADAKEGTNKLYFWNANASVYHQSVHQVRRGLPNGTYTVSAWMKTNGDPYEARMEINGSAVYTDVSNTWKQYKSTVTVTDGKADIGFYANLKANTGLQIDDVFLTPTNLLANGGFETGNDSSWTEWHPDQQASGLGVDSAGVAEGNYKLYIFEDNPAPFHQSVHQKKEGLPNGSYTVSAMVKTTGQPHEARMEINGDTKINVIGDGTWKRFTANVTVTDGKVDVGFYANFPNAGPTSMEIDDVVLTLNYATNGGFETGGLHGWTEWHPAGQQTVYGTDYGVEDNNVHDVQEGSKELFIRSNSASVYHQSVRQTNTGLVNGIYLVTAWVKTTGAVSSPYEARMEVNETYLNLSPNGVWQQVVKEIEVTNGTLDVGFYVNLPASASLQVDSVTVTKQSKLTL